MLDGESLVISEFMADNSATLADQDGEFSDWVEVYNPAAESVDLSGWHLTDDVDELDKWTFGAVALPGGERLVVFASGKDRQGAQLHTNFNLRRGGEYLALVQPDGATVQFAYAPEYPSQDEDVSYGLSADLSTRGFFLNPTPGTANVEAPVDDPDRQVLLSEIMYHPASEIDAEEFVELYNAGLQTVDLTGWQISDGVDFTFPAVSIAPGEYLAVAADTGTFVAKYPGVNNVVGGWSGRLSNGGEQVELEDELGRRVDRVRYADQGDWAVRDEGPLEFGFRGWEWNAAHDGLGKSVELINVAASNNPGQNWAASIPDEGTPGVANSVAATDVAPLIRSVEHLPLIPNSSDEVTVLARVTDELGAPENVTLSYRLDGEATFTTVAMLDDGIGRDTLAGDGTYATTLPAQANGAVVEFYVTASDVTANDGGGAARSLPAPIASTGRQDANFLYRVDNSVDADGDWTPGSQPIYYLIMTEAERADLEEIGDDGAESDSNAQMNGTFISIDGTGAKLRYNVGIRNRGHGSRRDPPNNYRINIPHDDPWNGFTGLNINSKYTHSQVFGSAIHRMAGIAVGDVAAVQVRVNGQNLAEPAGRMFGTYAHIEPLDGDMADKHFPDDSAGNLYKALRTDGGGDEADLRYEGTDPDEYRDTYFKQTNDELDDWSDLINMTFVLHNAPAETFFEEISQVIDVEQWTHYLALDVLMNNWETGLVRGLGDDYAFYRGVLDPRFKLVPHDLDTLFGEGNARGPIDQDIFSFTGVAGFEQLFEDPLVVQMFYAQVLDLIRTTFNPQLLDPLIDQVLGPWVPRTTTDSMKQFIVGRTSAVLAQIPQQLSVASGLPSENGFPRSTDGTTVDLSGNSHAALTRSVLVGGQLAEWDVREARWSIDRFDLRPGINRVIVQAFDDEGGTGHEIDRLLIDVWYDTGGGSATTSFVPAGSVWSYLDDGSDQNTAWREPGFNDVAWESGPAELGYGDNEDGPGGVAPGGTGVGFVDTDPIAAGNQRNITTYFRHTFEIPEGEAALLASASIDLLRDDGAAVYLNGTEVIRSNLPGEVGDATPILFDTPATDNMAGGEEEAFTTFSIDPALLVDGPNVLAVEVHQETPTSSDISFDLRLNASRVSTGEILTLNGTLAEDTVLLAEAGPYLVTGEVTVPDGVTLTIEPGTTVYFEEDTRIVVRGVIEAVGTQYDRIRLSVLPGTPVVPDIRPELPDGPPKWGGIQLRDTNSPDNVLAFLDIDFAQTSQGAIGVVDSEVLVDNVSFSGTHLRMIRTDSSSIIIRNSVFPDMFAPNEFPVEFTPTLDNVSEHINAAGLVPDGGHYIIENNLFGTNKGHNDVIDLTGGRYPGPVAVVRNNIFLGGGDEAIDGGGDILFEGNLFMNFAKDLDNTGTGDSNVITTSDSASSVMMIVRNTFMNIDHTVNFKRDAYGYFENNTVINVTAPHLSLATDTPLRMLNFSAINFLIPHESNPAGGQPRDTPPGKGAFTSGNIFTGIPQTVFGHVDFINPFIDPPVNQVLEVHNSLVPSAAALAGADGVNGRQFDFIEGAAGLADPAERDFSLRPGSPAIGSGPNGIDMGSQVPEGASISGEPRAITPRNEATLTIGGPGVLSFEYRVNDGPWQAEISILDPRSDLDNPRKNRFVDIQLTDLVDGQYTVFARGRNFAGEMQQVPTASKTWTVDTSLSRVFINEVLAINQSAFEHQGLLSDAIELHDDGHPDTPPVDLSGMSISDDPSNPRAFVFPQGTTIAPGEYLVLFADDDATTPGIHLGFSLDGDGEGVYLYEALGEGGARGALVDSVELGLQIADFSYGRAGHDREWTLNRPTIGGENVAQQTGDPMRLVINEWLADSEVLFANDFIEIYNPDPLPVPIGGLYITDDPVAKPLKHKFPPVSFIDPGGYRVLLADEDAGQNARHVNFRLSPLQEMIALFDAQGSEIDKVLYYGQTTDVSQGRAPDAATEYAFFELPTPGVRNSVATTDTNTERIELLPFNAQWSYEQSATDLGSGWRALDFNDSAWPTGAGPLGVENSTLSVPLNTNLTLHQEPYYFRAHFTLDIDPADITALNLTTQIDDGAVIYFNDVADHRVGMPGGAVNFGTFANRTVGNASLEGPFAIPTSALRRGDNVIAVESHQHNGGNSSDIVMGLTLEAEITRTTSGDDDSYEEELALLAVLRVTEVMYNPTDGSALEFIELRNTNLEPLDLTGVRIRGGIDFAFPEMTLRAGQYVVVISDRNAFEAKYGTDILIAGQYTGNLSNGGENVIVRLADPLDAAALRFEYRDTWVASTDGGGFSLIISDQFAHPATWQDRESWQSGTQLGGTPGRGDFDPPPPEVPTGLSASDDGLSHIALAWDEVFDPQSEILHYNVYRDLELIGRSVGASFIDTAVVAGETYSYQVAAFTVALVEGFHSGSLVHRLHSILETSTLELTTRDSYLPDTPFSVRVEIHNESGEVVRDVWDSVAMLSVDQPGITLSTDRVVLYNGLGSELVTASGSGDFTITATLAGLSVEKQLKALDAATPFVEVSGTLPGDSTTWDGIVHVTGNLLVPAGHTLTIGPGTLVLIDGVPEGDEDGADLDIVGSILSLGTAEQPVTFTAFDPALPWGELHHNGADPSLYRFTNITRGGSSPGIGHTGTGPTIRAIDSTIAFEDVSITDLGGKVMWADGADLTFHRVHLARATMGPEITDTALLMEDSWITEMFGPNDNDGIYLREQQAGQQIVLRRGVVADGDDDGIDTLGSTVVIEDYIIRDLFDKGASINGGRTSFVNTLVVHSDIGIETKSGGEALIDHSTLVENVSSLRREDAGGSTTVTNSIIIGTGVSVFTEDDPDVIRIDYSLTGQAWPGTRNVILDPMFISVATSNFHLRPDSPAIDSGDPSAPLDPDGTQTDMGAFPFSHGPAPQFTIHHTPHLQLGNAPLGSATDQVEIIWQTETIGPDDVDAFVVQYRKLGEADWTTVADLSVIDTGVGTRLNHSAVIEGLDYNTFYQYRLRHLRGGQVVDTLQDAFRTRLAPGDNETFTFVAYGDSASGNPPTGLIGVQSRINTIDPAFALLLGDNAYGESRPTWGSHASHDLRFDPAINPATPRFVSGHVEYAAIGNAELEAAGGQATRDNFSMPQNGTVDTPQSGTYFADRPEHNYSFDYGNVHFVSFDGNSVHVSANGPERFADQMAWLVDDLSASEAEWKVVFTHFPLVAPQAGFGASTAYFQQLFTALDDAGVDLLLAGHSHTYQRSYPITGETGGTVDFVFDEDNDYAKGAGLVQVISGTGGRSLSGGNIAATPYLAAAFTTATQPASRDGFARIDVEGDTLTVRYIAADNGAVLDRFTITAEASSVAEVVGRHVFYNNSSFDAAGDDAAIATDKTALLPGQTASFTNYTSFPAGINGLMIDVAAIADPASIGPADFELRVGNTNDPSTWPLATLPEITVRQGAGPAGSGRITLVWDDADIVDTWLQVTLRANGRTGLPADDVFYFGNAPADTGAGNLAGVVLVDGVDRARERANQQSGIPLAAIDNVFDFNRDGQVDAPDRQIARQSSRNFLTGLRLIAPQVAAPAPPEQLAIAGPLPDEAPAAAADDTFDRLGRHRRRATSGAAAGLSRSAVATPRRSSRTIGFRPVASGTMGFQPVALIDRLEGHRTSRRAGSGALHRLQAVAVDAAMDEAVDEGSLLRRRAGRAALRRLWANR